MSTEPTEHPLDIKAVPYEMYQAQTTSHWERYCNYIYAAMNAINQAIHDRISTDRYTDSIVVQFDAPPKVLPLNLAPISRLDSIYKDAGWGGVTTTTRIESNGYKERDAHCLVLSAPEKPNAVPSTKPPEPSNSPW